MLAGQNSEALEVVFGFLKDQALYLDLKYGGGVFLLPRMYKGVITQLNDTGKVKPWMDEMQKAGTLNSIRKELNQALETVVVKERVRINNENVFENYA